MKLPSHVGRIKKVTFPTCPRCRQKKLKEFYYGKANKEKIVIRCTYCGLEYVKGKFNPDAAVQEKFAHSRGGYCPPIRFKSRYEQQWFCKQCNTTMLFKHKKFPRRWICSRCGWEKEFMRKI